jgi:hypothetical protein
MTRHPAILAAIFTMTAVYGGAHATDYKVVNGSECQAIYGGDEQYLYRSYPGLVNFKAADVLVVCSLPRDNHTAALTKLKVTVLDSSNEGAVQCYFAACNNYGTRCYQNAAGTNWGGTGYNVLDLTRSRHFAAGHYSMYCRLPAGSQILSILLGEP